MTESMDRMSTTIGSMTHHALNFSTSSSVFEGFTNDDICCVPSDIWEIMPRMNSCTIHVHEEQAFDSLEAKVNKSYGSPQEMANIYRGEIPISNGSTCVTITFYKTTFKVRVQGSGYAMWVNKILPSLVDNVMMTPSSMTFSTPIHNSLRIATHTQANDSCDTSDHCSLHRDFLKTVLNATEVKAKLEKENAMLKDRIHELSDDNSKLNQKLTEKEIQLESMMARVAEVDLLEFESASNLKMLEATEARFAKERKHFLQQIQDLTNKDQPSPSSPACTSPPTYSEVLQWSTVKSKRHSNTPTNVKPAVTTTSNRFAVLSDEDSESSPLSSTDSSPPPPDAPNHNRTRKPTPAAAPPHNPPSAKRSKPQVVILGDSERIDGQHLSRSAQVMNFSVGGRKVEQVCDDVIKHKAHIAEADSLIFHVGTNDLERDNVGELNAKIHKLCKMIKAHAPRQCEVALSSVVNRRDNPSLASKVKQVNQILSNVCDTNRWTYIDNDAVRDLTRDNLHPNDKGLSFLARNFQDFVRCAHPSLFRRAPRQRYQQR